MYQEPHPRSPLHSFSATVSVLHPCPCHKTVMRDTTDAAARWAVHYATQRDGQELETRHFAQVERLGPPLVRCSTVFWCLQVRTISGQLCPAQDAPKIVRKPSAKLYSPYTPHPPRLCRYGALPRAAAEGRNSRWEDLPWHRSHPKPLPAINVLT